MQRADELGITLLKNNEIEKTDEQANQKRWITRGIVAAVMIAASGTAAGLSIRDLRKDENAAKQMLSEDIQIFLYGGPACYDEANDVLVSNLMKSKFIHFQITQNSDGGFEAYAVFCTPEGSRAVIIRLCK